MLTSKATYAPSSRANDFWPRAQATLRAELGDHRYGMWIAPLRLKSADDGRVVLSGPTQFLCDNVREKYGERIAALIAFFSGQKRVVMFEPIIAAPVGRDPQPLFDGTELPAAPAAERRITVDQVKRRATEWYKLQPGDLESRSRKRDVVRPRQIATYVARQLTKQSFPQIARKFGPRDHSTILHGCQLVEELMTVDPAFAADVKAFMHSVRDETPS
jgi:chromosomal replication initiation ATPase DnaA